MILMIGKKLRRRAFSAVIAAGAALVALVLLLTAVFTGAMLLKNGEKSALDKKEQAAEEGAFVLKSEDASIYDPARDGEVIRLHIVANSDSSEDQRVKLLVRDRLLALANLTDDILHPSSISEAEGLLKTSGNAVLSAVRSALKDEGAGYDAQLIIGDFDFPDREYGGKLYPAGKYRALRILLGDAGGKNWWCILFPPLCIIRAEEQPTPAAQMHGAERNGAEDLFGQIKPCEQDGAIHFESLFVKLFNRIFHGED